MHLHSVSECHKNSLATDTNKNVIRWDVPVLVYDHCNRRPKLEKNTHLANYLKSTSSCIAHNVG